MRVSVVTTSWPMSEGDPSGHFVRTEALALAAEGHDVTVIAPDAAVFPAFGWPGALPRLRENPFRVFGAARWIRSARQTLELQRFDRIIAHWVVPCGLLVPERGELELVSHGSDVTLLLGLPAIVRHRMVQALAERASTWRFVSDGLLDRLARAVPQRSGLDRVAVVRPCPIEIPDVSVLARRIRSEMRQPFVSAIGRLVSSKRTERIVETAAKERVPLVVVGDGPERSKLERDALRFRADARFVGRVRREEALAWMSASSSLWFASRSEGLPTVLREAEALGVPVRIV